PTSPIRTSTTRRSRPRWTPSWPRSICPRRCSRTRAPPAPRSPTGTDSTTRPSGRPPIPRPRTSRGFTSATTTRPASTSRPPPPTTTDVLNAVTGQMQGAPVTAPCPQGPVSAATPAANSAWLYITEPNPPGSVETTPPPNAPGGEYPATAGGGCSAVNPAVGNDQLQVTIRFNLVLITPIVAQATANHIVMTAAAVFRTEY